MKIDKELENRLKAIFAPLNKKAAGGSIPPPSSLSKSLEKVIARRPMPTTSNVELTTATYFATAAVEAWFRAVHSFLVSASLTDASPIWASVSGYYSSHYSVRAFAHLLGYFHLFQKRLIVRLEIHGGRHVCVFDRKTKGDREHRLYWHVVKKHPHFNSDPLFTENDPGSDASDVGHRDRANYIDHLSQYPNFQVLDIETLKRRVQYISQIRFTTPPIPKLSRFPDVVSVQVVAYHRMVKFRQFLDEVLGGKNRFWNVCRNPSWAGSMIDFQLTEQGGLDSFRN